MDGTAGVTQCPIAPGDSFLYNFKADVAGTYWYHSHIGRVNDLSAWHNLIWNFIGLQYCDGVRGALIVQDPADHLAILYDGTLLMSIVPNGILLIQLLVDDGEVSSKNVFFLE